MVRKIFTFLVVMIAIGLLGSTGVNASGPVVWDQGFEEDVSGWFDNDDYAGYGEIIRVPSGYNSIDSKSGDFHAVVVEEYPYSRFDMYRSEWPVGGWFAEIDVYLDTDWALGSGFDYSVASSGSDGLHQRDFIFHVMKDTSTTQLLIGGSNNTNYNPREDIESLANHFVITETGWYTLRHTFRDEMGVLAVDLQLVDGGGNVLWTETRSAVADLMSEIGGNRYAWFTAMTPGLDLAVDNHRLTIPSLFVRSAEITSPLEDSTVSGMVNFTAVLHDDDVDAIQWAVRQGTCAAGTNTVFGNVDGKNDVASIDPSNLGNQTFSFTGDMSSMTPGMYCFIYNPVEDAGEPNIRLTSEFILEEPEVVLPEFPTSKDMCKSDGWRSFSTVTFKNQGDCVSWVQSSEKAVGNRKGN